MTSHSSILETNNSTKNDTASAAFQSAESGVVDFVGDEATILEFTYDDTTWQSQLENAFASEQYDIIIVGTYDMLEMTVALTEEYPDQ